MGLHYKQSLFLLTSLIIGIYAEMESVCSNYSQSIGIPVVTFCADSHVSNSAVVMDGYYANIISDISCNCIIRSNNSQIIQLSHLRGLFQMDPDCGSEIIIKIHSIGLILKCDQTGSMHVEENDEIRITLLKTGEPYDARYCFLLGILESSLDVTCFSNNNMFETEAPEMEISTISETSRTSTSIYKLESTEMKSSSSDNFATTFSEIKTSVSISSDRNNSEANAKSSNSDDRTLIGLVIATALGWILVSVSVAMNVILINQRRQYIRNQEENRIASNYAELQSQRDLSNYCSIGPAGQTAQEYEIVTNNAV